MSERARAMKRVVLSSALLLAAMGLAMSVDHSFAGVFVALAFLLGIPCLLLSLIDLGKALRAASTEGFRASRTSWWLAQLQAAFGALCAAVGGFVVYTALADYATGAAAIPWLMVMTKVVVAAMLVAIGIHYIYDAFVSGRKQPSGD